MSVAVGIFNKLITALFGAVIWPFRSLGPLWTLTVVSVLAGILMLWIFGKVSNQDKIRVIRDRIRGNLIGIRLFGDDPRQLFRLQGRILRDTAVYLRHAFAPILVMLIPVLLILVQLNLHFSAKSLEPGEPTVVKVTLRDAAVLRDEVQLSAPNGVRIETPGVRIESLGEVAWRVSAERPGRHLLTARIGAETVQKELVVGGQWGPVSTLRTGRDLLEMLLYPGEPPIDAERIESIEVRYAALPLSLFGWGVHWLVYFFILSILAGFAFSRALGVEI